MKSLTKYVQKARLSSFVVAVYGMAVSKEVFK